MAEVTVEGDRLVVRITGLNKLWALKSRLRIPLDHVRGATADSGIAKEHKGIRAPGTHLPRVITAGTYYRDGERVFWDVRDPARVVVIELVEERYARLVLQVGDPEAVAMLVERSKAA
ncbi:hypothetical protein [Mycobacterium sp. IDR2000157661]|uniref:hypothetical protein n=1 Tax=Mycobacterium sp. IDR2000157661 TaxID=2867005 RepID=UPI001EEB55C0|nr:hypothetical protein [Mycobacterium sp. IDR2000157661]ULE31437.1 hypothetical protein K3G64_14475 [Mycobacterium sp. IDR2000157661]